MTDNEIIKGINYCANVEYRKNCDNCPIKAVCDSEDYGAIKLVNDLINRQKAEIEQLNTVNAEMHESLRLASEANKDMQAEIDALRKTILDADYSSITALKAKESWHMENSIYIYRLNERIDRLQADNSSMQSTLAKMSMGVEQAKSEAIKEFAERLKTEQSFYDGQETRIYLTEKDLDNLVKEMVGEG